MSDVMKRTSERSFFIWIDFDDYDAFDEEDNIFGPEPRYRDREIRILQIQETDSGWMAEVEYK